MYYEINHAHDGREPTRYHLYDSTNEAIIYSGKLYHNLPNKGGNYLCYSFLCDSLEWELTEICADSQKLVFIQGERLNIPGNGVMTVKLLISSPARRLPVFANLPQFHKFVFRHLSSTNSHLVIKAPPFELTTVANTLPMKTVARILEQSWCSDNFLTKEELVFQFFTCFLKFLRF